MKTGEAAAHQTGDDVAEESLQRSRWIAHRHPDVVERNREPVCPSPAGVVGAIVELGVNDPEPGDLLALLDQQAGHLEGQEGAEGVAGEAVGPLRLEAADQLDVARRHLLDARLRLFARVQSAGADAVDGHVAFHPGGYLTHAEDIAPDRMDEVKRRSLAAS